MADSKIDFSFENLHFSCEGDNEWVERQLNNVLSRIPSLLSVHKKNEGIVEDVIEVREEDIKEVTAERVRKATKVSGRNKKSSVSNKKPKTAGEKKTVVGESDSVSELSPKLAATGVSASKGANKSGRKQKAAKSAKQARPAKKAGTKKKKEAAGGISQEQVISTLSRFIDEKKVANNQVRKFLATAVFLSRNNNLSKLSTPVISKALKLYGIDRLQNASDCLNKNEKKGYCIKDGREFIITEDGYKSVEKA